MIEIGKLIVARNKTAVYRGRVHSAPAAIKQFDAFSQFNRESQITRLLSTICAPVPRYLWHGLHDGKLTLATEWVEGKPGRAVVQQEFPYSRSVLIGEVAQALGRLHCAASTLVQIDLRVLLELKGAQPQAANWSAHLLGQLQEWMGRLSNTSRASLGGEIILSNFSERVKTTSANELLTLVHCDYSLRNVMVTGDGRVFIVDFGAASVGDGRYDLAKIVWSDFGGMETAEATTFITQWCKVTGCNVPHELLAIYVGANCIAGLAWVDTKRIADARDARFAAKAITAFQESSRYWHR
jgi:aminoglycoside phosphotransferase (APT) family kinase protein